MQHVIAYVDGVNLYFGLKDSRFKTYYSLDLPTLANALLKPDQQLVPTHYFTARIRTNGRNADNAKHQTTYIDALAAQPKGHCWRKPSAEKTVGLPERHTKRK